ncbi:MAG: N-acetylmuramoyl-L-alanine amidase [Candidatus Firestonebacteria bacterium]
METFKQLKKSILNILIFTLVLSFNFSDVAFTATSTKKSSTTKTQPSKKSSKSTKSKKVVNKKKNIIIKIASTNEQTEMKFDVKSVNGVLKISIPRACEVLKVGYSYSELTNRIVLIYNNRKTVLFLDSKYFLCENERNIEMEDAPSKDEKGILISGKSFASILSALFNCEVFWNETRMTLLIETDAKKDAISSVNTSFKDSGYKLKKIIIDAGHGGHDSGAKGPTKLLEKDMNIDIANRIVRLLKSKLPIEIIMTRTDDTFISLQERVNIANTNNADLFVSIHCNAKGRRVSAENAYGTESYIFAEVASDENAAEVAQRENIGAPTDFLSFLLNDLQKKSTESVSILMAGYIEDKLVNDVGLYGRKNSMIMRAPFYVLARTKMPAVLVEVAFISNPQEEQKLASPYFREKVALAVFQAIKKYHSELNLDEDKAKEPIPTENQQSN